MSALSVIIINNSVQETFDLLKLLHLGGYTVLHQQVESALDLEATLAQQPWDIILSDYQLSEFSALQALQILQKKHLNIPFILIADAIPQTDVITILQQGVHNYVKKANISRLIPIIERELLIPSNTRKRQLNPERLTYRKSEIELRNSEARFRSLVENTFDIWMILNFHGQICYASPAITQKLGYYEQDWQGVSLIQWIHPGDQDSFTQIVDAIQDLSHHNQPSPLLAQPIVILRLLTQAQDWRIFDTLIQPCQYRTNLTGIVIHARDITEREQLSQLQRAIEQEKALSEMKLNFFSMASHEFRTPLSIITLASQMLAETAGPKLDAKEIRNLERITNASNEIRQLLNDILYLSRAEANKLTFSPQNHNLYEVCQLAIDAVLASNSPPERLKFTYASKLVQGRFDCTLVTSILTNLLSNALKYSQPDDPVHFTVSPEPKMTTFQIQDWGMGIPVDEAAQLFQTFFRASNVGKISGTGLGLTIVKRCTELHGGWIDFTSTPGEGTCFTVQLPIRLT